MPTKSNQPSEREQLEQDLIKAACAVDLREITKNQMGGIGAESTFYMESLLNFILSDRKATTKKVLEDLLEHQERMYYPNHTASDGAIPVSIIKDRITQLEEKP